MAARRRYETTPGACRRAPESRESGLAESALLCADTIDQGVEIAFRRTALLETLRAVHDRFGQDFVQALGAGEVAGHALDLGIIENRGPGLVAGQRADPFGIVLDERIRRHVH